MALAPWTNIANTAVDQDSPWTELVATGIKENVERAMGVLLAPGIAPDAAQVDEGHAHRGPLIDGSAAISLGERIYMKDEAGGLIGPTSATYSDIQSNSFGTGELRHNVVRNLSQIDIRIWDNSASSLTDESATLQHEDTVNVFPAILDQAADYIYCGADAEFAEFLFSGFTYSTGSNGAVVAEYYNGTSFTALSGVTDGTAVSGNTMRQRGSITWTLPIDWAIGADSLPGLGGLDSTMFYIRLKQTNNPTAGFRPDQAAPKVDTATMAVIYFEATAAADTPHGVRARRNGTSVTAHAAFESEGDNEGILIVPLDTNEIAEHREVGAGNFTTYELVGYII